MAVQVCRVIVNNLVALIRKTSEKYEREAERERHTIEIERSE